MKKTILLAISLFIMGTLGYAQVSINSDNSPADASAILDVKSSTKGFLIPRVALTGATDNSTIPSPANSLLIFNTATAGSGSGAVTPGFYFNSGTPSAVNWIRLSTGSAGGGSGTEWLRLGNSGTISGTDFIGTTDNQPFDIRTYSTIHARFNSGGGLEFLNNGQSLFIGEQVALNDNLADNRHVFIGYRAGYSATSGKYNTGIGNEALRNASSGRYNTAVGSRSLYTLTSPNAATAVGFAALYSNGQHYNVAIGDSALYTNFSGYGNTAIGSAVLKKNYSGNDNTAIGTRSLAKNRSDNNTAAGYGVLSNNEYGLNNTAMGEFALAENVGGGYNTAVGNRALEHNTESHYSVANGAYALQANTTGFVNTAIGNMALSSNTGGSYNVAAGEGASGENVNGSGNVAIGHAAGFHSDADANTLIGDSAGFAGQTGFYNTYAGSRAGRNAVGINNSFLGKKTGYNSTGNWNSFLGNEAAVNMSGSGNVVIGYGAGNNFTSGTQNVIIGMLAGSQSSLISTGSNNVLIGYNASEGAGNRINSIVIGSGATATADGQVRLGNISIASMYCKGVYVATTSNPPNANVNGEGQFMRSIDPGSLYSNEGCFDYDGNAYPTVRIGNQVWMAENLRVSNYKNGDDIYQAWDNSSWSSADNGLFCWYQEVYEWHHVYGNLYNWYAVTDNRGLCPNGWHIPTDEDWTTLINSLRGASIAGSKMKSNTPLWAYPGWSGTNSSGMSALPGGYRDSNGNYSGITGEAAFWSSTAADSGNAWSRNIPGNNSGADRNSKPKTSGFSVRCIRN